MHLNWSILFNSHSHPIDQWIMLFNEFIKDLKKRNVRNRHRMFPRCHFPQNLIINVYPLVINNKRPKTDVQFNDENWMIDAIAINCERYECGIFRRCINRNWNRIVTTSTMQQLWSVNDSLVRATVESCTLKHFYNFFGPISLLSIWSN